MLLRNAGLSVLLALLTAGRALAQQDTFSVYFPFNSSVLTEESKFYIDSVIYANAISANKPLQIIGYADAVGADTFNLRLSRQRADGVRSYLIRSGFRKGDITLIIGKGEATAKAPEQPGGNQPDRRVDIVSERPKRVKSPRPMPPARITVFSPTPAAPRLASTTDLGSVPVGETVVLDNIYFYAGRHIVREDSRAALDELVASLKDHPNVRIRIEGHVCCVPARAKDALDDDTGYEELSVNRAAYIREYLIKNGIPEDRLSFIGFGHKRPVVPVERSEEDANRNRRVEIRIVE